MKKLSLSLLIIGLFIAPLFTQPVADFSASVTEGCTPLEVIFSNISTGNNLTHVWDFGDGNTSTQANPTHTFLQGVSYQVCLTVMDDMGLEDTECKVDYITTYEPNSFLNFNLCDGDLVIVNGITYDMPGNYQEILPGEGTWGCDSIININLSFFPPAETIISTDTLCEGETVTINGVIYNYQLPSGIEVLENVSYNGCDSTIFVDLIFQPIDSTHLNFNACAGSSVDVNGVLYDEAQPSGSQTFQNAIGCDSVLIINVDFTETPEVTAMVLDLNCNGASDGAIDLMVTNGMGNETFDWDDLVGNNNVQDRSGLMPGTYSVTVTNEFGCSTALDFSIAEPSTLSITLINDLILDCSTNALFVNPLISGGTPPYNYTWSNGANSTGISVFMAGIYSVTIMDSNSCIEVMAFEVVEETDLPVLSVGAINLTCPGEANGAIEITVSGGCPNYSYLWSDGSTAQDLINVVAGIYSLTITDCNNCIAVLGGIVVDENVIEGSIATPAITCPGEQITVCFNPDVPDPNLTYEWSHDTGTIVAVDACFTIASLNTSSVGCYNLVVTNTANLCTRTDQVCFPAFEIYDINASMNTLCLGDSTQLFVDPELTGATYVWEAGAESLSCITCPNPFAKPTMTTSYSVTIVDAQGCMHATAFDMAVDSFCVWPGDTDTNKVVNNFDLLAIGLSIDSVGPLRPNANIGWFGQAGPSWMQNTPGTNIDLQHVDTDGNGVINSDDTLAIALNWGSVHLFQGESNDYQFTNNGTTTQSVAMAPFYVQVDTFFEGETIGLPIILGDMGVPLENLYGLAYTIEYDSSIVNPSSAFVDFNNSWVGQLNNNLIGMQRDFYSPGQIDVGMTRIDGEPMDGFGAIATLFITIQDDILFRSGDTRSPEDGLAAEFQISNVLLLTHQGEIIPIEPNTTYSLVTEMGTSLSEEVLDQMIEVYPNPSKGTVYIQAENIKLEQISIYNVVGQLVQEISPNHSGQITTTVMEPGTYFLKIKTEEGSLSKRIIILN